MNRVLIAWLYFPVAALGVILKYAKIINVLTLIIWVGACMAWYIYWIRNNFDVTEAG